MSRGFPTCRWARAAFCGGRTCPSRRWPGTRAPSVTSFYAASVSACRDRFASAALGLKEAHLDAGQLDHVVVGKSRRLRADGSPVDEWKIIIFAAIHVHNEIAVHAARDGSHLHARSPERRQCLGELQLAAGKGA